MDPDDFYPDNEFEDDFYYNEPYEVEPEYLRTTSGLDLNENYNPLAEF